MKTWSLVHCQEGWRLDVVTVPAWAHLTETAWERAVWLLDPCCVRPWRWFSHRLGPIGRAWSAVHERLLEAPPGSVAHRRRVTCYSALVDVLDARRLNPTFVAEMEHIMGDDGPEPAAR